MRQLLRWLIPLTFGFALLVGVIFAITGDAGAAVTGGVLLGYGVVLISAWICLQRARLNVAVAMICGGLLVGTLVVSLVQPELAPTLAVTPLLAVMVAIPYAGGRPLSLLIILALLVTLTAGIAGELLVPRLQPHPWFESVFRVGSLVVAVATVMLLLWQFSSRLTSALARSREAEERYALAAQGANDGLWDWDLTDGRVYFSPRWKGMLGYTQQEVGDDPEEWFGRVHPEERAQVEERLKAHLDGNSSQFESEHRLLHRDGEYRWVLSRGMAVRDGAGEATRIAGSQAEITKRKRAEERLSYQAFRDELTGLPNRAAFSRRLEAAVERVRVEEEYLFAVLFLDLDRFKNVNDSLGHTVGDEMLVEISRRLKRCLRPGDMVARMGGDEFIILLDGLGETGDAKQVAERLQEDVAAPLKVENHELFASASIGIVLHDTRHEKPEDLLRDADTALYRAKSSGRARHKIFTPEMHDEAMASLELEAELRRGIERQEFLAHYQPIISLMSGRIAGFEALVRWEHPQRGLLLPKDFLDVAEEAELISPMFWTVLRQACRQTNVWQSSFPAHSPLTVNVNLSGSQLSAPGLVKDIGDILRETGFDARRLHLEITETEVMRGADDSMEGALSQLRGFGLQVHIDDFGTGYSSLSTLHRFPIDVLKIDRSFVESMGADGENVEIAQTIVTLAHNLGMDVIAEGVETESQLVALRALGCDYAQGYLFSKPLEARDVEGLIAEEPRW